MNPFVKGFIAVAALLILTSKNEVKKTTPEPTPKSKKKRQRNAVVNVNVNGTPAPTWDDGKPKKEENQQGSAAPVTPPADPDPNSETGGETKGE